jgi:hypothetical protein
VDTIFWSEMPGGEIWRETKLGSDKRAVLSEFSVDRFCVMAEPKEPKKETVRMVLPPHIAAKSPGGNVESRDRVRIQLPPRQPSNKPSFQAPPQAQTTPEPPGKEPLPAQVAPPPAPAVSPPKPAVIAPPPPAPASVQGLVAPAPDSPFLGPKKETARIPLMPEPAKTPPAVQMKKTQPLIAMPPIAPRSAFAAASAETRGTGAALADAISMPVCWTLLGVSAVILIIQIWTYFS